MTRLFTSSTMALNSCGSYLFTIRSTNITTSTSDDGATSLGHTRADSNSSNIVLAAPLNGTTNDYSATIKGSGNNITPNVSGTAAETSNTQLKTY